jgi:hypothetical protein
MRSTAQFVEQETDIAPPSPAAIADGVPKTAKHAALDERIGEMEAEREACLAEMRTLIAGPRDESGDSRIRRLGKRRDVLQEGLWPMRQAIRPLRDAHVAAIRKALQPRAHEAAKAMLRDLEGLGAAIDFFNAIETAVEAAGGEPERIFRPPNFGALENIAWHRSGLGGDHG